LNSLGIPGRTSDGAGSSRRYGGYRLHSVGAIVQDAFRCSEEELFGYVAAAEAAGCTEVRLHDTVGTATPLGVAKRMDHLHGRFGRLRFGVHFHDDLGMALG
jgi:isopropylmalate/homocitrate/citramalate synthase